MEGIFLEAGSGLKSFIIFIPIFLFGSSLEITLPQEVEKNLQGTDLKLTAILPLKIGKSDSYK